MGRDAPCCRTGMPPNFIEDMFPTHDDNPKIKDLLWEKAEFYRLKMIKGRQKNTEAEEEENAQMSESEKEERELFREQERLKHLMLRKQVSSHVSMKRLESLMEKKCPDVPRLSYMYPFDAKGDREIPVSEWGAIMLAVIFANLVPVRYQTQAVFEVGKKIIRGLRPELHGEAEVLIFRIYMLLLNDFSACGIRLRHGSDRELILAWKRFFMNHATSRLYHLTNTSD